MRGRVFLRRPPLLVYERRYLRQLPLLLYERVYLRGHLRYFSFFSEAPLPRQQQLDVSVSTASDGKGADWLHRLRWLPLLMRGRVFLRRPPLLVYERRYLRSPLWYVSLFSGAPPLRQQQLDVSLCPAANGKWKEWLYPTTGCRRFAPQSLFGKSHP